MTAATKTGTAATTGRSGKAGNASTSSAPARLRCALYTRKSSEEGLDQAFNSLHAQREACEAYVLSQAGEGWRAIATPYDDGGFSGGSMERPALKQLLADIAAGRIDVVVVYKIDRLTRSLADFARMVELFDTHKVSFVSVTQAFNTTTSMGRLTLNVLLSFAQFEREVTGERIRDKIAASKAKGMWMGGQPPLGYDPPTDPATRALVVNAPEAETVRLIFATYLDLGSVHVLQRWLADRDIRSKARTTAAGRVTGDLPFSRGALFHLLRNRLYLGMIVHKTAIHPGAHLAIVAAELFAAVQTNLDGAARRHGARPNRVATAPLVGRVFDADGYPMSPTFSHGARGQVYRYYVSAPLQQGQRPDRTRASIGGAMASVAVRRVPAVALEARLADTMRRLLPRAADPLASILRVEVYPASLHVLLPITQLSGICCRLGSGETVMPDPADPTQLRLELPGRICLRGGRTAIEGAAPARSAVHDKTLIRALRAAHALTDSRDGKPFVEASPPTAHGRRLVRLAFLAPELQAAILAGRQPGELTVDRLIDTPPPLLWRHQIEAFAENP